MREATRGPNRADGKRSGTWGIAQGHVLRRRGLADEQEPEGETGRTDTGWVVSGVSAGAAGKHDSYGTAGAVGDGQRARGNAGTAAVKGDIHDAPAVLRSSTIRGGYQRAAARRAWIRSDGEAGAGRNRADRGCLIGSIDDRHLVGYRRAWRRLERDDVWIDP